MEELRSSEQRYRVLSEIVAEAVIVVQDGKIVFANRNFAAMFGFPGTGDVVGKDLGCLHCPSLQKHFMMNDEVIASGNCHKRKFQAHCTTAAGRNFRVQIQQNIIKWNSKPAIQATLKDITATKLEQTSFEKERERPRKENVEPSLAMKDRCRLDHIVGKSPAMQEVYDFVVRASESDTNIVIEGESGTGKELVALTIHKMSSRREKPFLPVNCGAIPETLFESEFFGHRKGAFTGAYIDKPGLFDYGSGGTIFLDEVGELSHNMQVKLLRAIEGKGYSPVGGNQIKQSA